MVTALIVCAVLVYLFRRSEPFVLRYLNLLEQKQAGSQAPKKIDPIPQFLWLNAMNESESWAREDALKRMYQLYEEHGNNWDNVSTIIAPDSVKVD